MKGNDIKLGHTAAPRNAAEFTGRAVAIAAISLTSCSPDWPKDQFPAEVEVQRTLFAESQNGLRETCEAMVVELTDAAASSLGSHFRSVNGRVIETPPAGWSPSPKPKDEHAYAFYKGAFGGCNDEGRTPLGDLGGALEWPGSYYKVINNGEGIGIIEPRAKLAAYFYFG